MPERDYLRVVEGSETEQGQNLEPEAKPDLQAIRQRGADLGFEFDDKGQIAKKPEYVFYIKPNGTKVKARVKEGFWDNGEYVLKLSVELNSGRFTPFEASINNEWLERYNKKK